MDITTICWYVGAWAEDVPETAAVARRLLDEPVVLVRGGAVTAHALFDCCPHRFVPLSLERVENGTITCACHELPAVRR